jgi:hypothetical protein
MVKINGVRYGESALLAAWKCGNDAGQGFSVGFGYDMPREALERVDFADLTVHVYDLDPEGSIVAYDADRVIVIRDHNGPLAVDVTNMFDKLGDLID